MRISFPKKIFPWTRSKGECNSTSQKMIQRSSKGKFGHIDSAIKYKSQQQECDFHGTPRQYLQTGTEKPSQENSSDQQGNSEQSLFLCSICRRFVAQKRTHLKLKSSSANQKLKVWKTGINKNINIEHFLLKRRQYQINAINLSSKGEMFSQPISVLISTMPSKYGSQILSLNQLH